MWNEMKWVCTGHKERENHFCLKEQFSLNANLEEGCFLEKRNPEYFSSGISLPYQRLNRYDSQNLGRFSVKSKVGSEQEGEMLVSEDQVQLTSIQCKDNRKNHWLTAWFIHQILPARKKKKIGYISQLSLNYWEPFILTHYWGFVSACTHLLK